MYSNKISELSGLETLKNLTILSLGKNLLTKHEQVVEYLKKLNSNLRVLKLAENQFQKHGSQGAVNENDYKLYAIQFLKTLKYFDYKLIT